MDAPVSINRDDIVESIPRILVTIWSAVLIAGIALSAYIYRYGLRWMDEGLPMEVHRAASENEADRQIMNLRISNTRNKHPFARTRANISPSTPSVRLP